MPRRPYRASIILSDKKFKYEFEPNKAQLEELLNNKLDLIISRMKDQKTYAVRITNTEDGIIMDVGIDKTAFDELYYTCAYEL